MKNASTINPLNEWPTWLAIIGVYLLWLLILMYFNSSPFAPVLLVFVLGFHGSVQHELLHGHPTKHQVVNDILAYPPLSLWYPYPVYKNTHLRHHKDVDLTIPNIDPESYFISPQVWQEMSQFYKLAAKVNMTLLGRLLFAPFWHFIDLKKQMFRSVSRPSSAIACIWLVHELLCLVLLICVGLIFNVNIVLYFLCAYFAQSLMLLRSFYEHRVEESPGHRSVVVESFLPFKLLFLNNNFHAVHHQNPGMSWFKLSKEYYSNRDYYDQQNNHFVESGYWRWFSKYAFKLVAQPKHPGVLKDE